MTFQHWAGVTAYTAPCGFARCCVFGKQSLPPGLCHPRQLGPQGPSPEEVILLPKLRMQFAEFLNHSSPDRLGILYPPTCVGLGYGLRASSLLGFSWQHGISDFACCGSASRLRVVAPTLIGTPLHAYPGTTIAPVHLPSCVPRQLPASSSVRSLPEGNSPHVATLGPGASTEVTGISTSCASTTPFGLALAPDSPWED